MPSDVTQWYWDTCIFVAYLNDNREAYGRHLDHIEQILDDCRRGNCQIHTSTVTIAEITAKRLANSRHGTFTDFLADYQGSILQVSADPIVMTLASKIKGLTYTKSGSPPREVGTADAIHLASAVVLVQEYGVQLAAFHTFDEGKKRGFDGGKGVPLLGYETWCDECKDDPAATAVIALNRCKPEHPFPTLPHSLVEQKESAGSPGKRDRATAPLSPEREQLKAAD